MSDNEYNIESATIPMEAGQIKKGGFIMIKGRPCKVINISVSSTGINFTATDIFTGKKLEDTVPSSHGATVPIISKTEWEILDIGEDGKLTLMNEGGFEKTDLNLPVCPETFAQEIRDAWGDGENQVHVTVQAAVGMEQVIACKKVSD